MLDKTQQQVIHINLLQLTRKHARLLRRFLATHPTYNFVPAFQQVSFDPNPDYLVPEVYAVGNIKFTLSHDLVVNKTQISNKKFQLDFLPKGKMAGCGKEAYIFERPYPNRFISAPVTAKTKLYKWVVMPKQIKPQRVVRIAGEIQDAEITCAKLLPYLNISSPVKFHDFRPHVQTQYVCYDMNFLPGKTLKTLINDDKDGKHTLNIFEKYQISLAVAKALAAFHKTNFVHRDIKPENIIVNKTKHGYVAYVIDLGSVKHISNDDSKQSNEHGSKLYRSPEAASNLNTTQTSDVVGLGISLFSLWGKQDAEIYASALGDSFEADANFGFEFGQENCNFHEDSLYQKAMQPIMALLFSTQQELANRPSSSTMVEKLSDLNLKLHFQVQAIKIAFANALKASALFPELHTPLNMLHAHVNSKIDRALKKPNTAAKKLNRLLNFALHTERYAETVMKEGLQAESIKSVQLAYNKHCINYLFHKIIAKNKLKLLVCSPIILGSTLSNILRHGIKGLEEGFMTGKQQSIYALAKINSKLGLFGNSTAMDHTRLIIATKQIAKYTDKPAQEQHADHAPR